MSIFWKIEYTNKDSNTKSFGYQILDDNMVTVKITDENGTELKGGFDYSFVEEATAPAWWTE